MSKSILAMVQGNVEQKIQAEENKKKAEFLKFLNKELEALAEVGGFFRSTRSFKIPRGESHPDWKRVAEGMGFEADYEFDRYYGDTIMLTTKDGEAKKLTDQHNRKVERERREEAKRKEEIRKETLKVADKVAKEILGKLRTGNYEVKSYGEKSGEIKVTYEKISFEGLDVEYFIFFVCDVLQNYKFKNVSFGGTVNDYFTIKVERKGCEDTK